MKSKLLLAMDNSKCSLKAARYVADLFGEKSDISVTLFHVLRSVPPYYLESGNFTDKPELDRERAEWEEAEHNIECKCMGPVVEMLKGVGFNNDQVEEKHFAPTPEIDVAEIILEEGEKGGYNTLVMGKRGHSISDMFATGSVTEKVVRHAKGKAVWVIE